jgi:hypothetical protein
MYRLWRMCRCLSGRSYSSRIEKDNNKEQGKPSQFGAVFYFTTKNKNNKLAVGKIAVGKTSRFRLPCYFYLIILSLTNSNHL